MKEILQQILVEVKENKESVKKLEKQILAEVQESKESVKNLEKQLLIEIQETKKSVKQLEEKFDKKLDQRLKEFEIKIDNKLDQRFKEFEVKIDKKFEEHTKLFDEKLAKYNSEISQELQNIVIYFDKKFKKQDNVNEAILKELKENRLEHESYNSRLYKIEVAQSNLKNQVNELAKQQGIAI